MADSTTPIASIEETQPYSTSLILVIFLYKYKKITKERKYALSSGVQLRLKNQKISTFLN